MTNPNDNFTNTTPLTPKPTPGPWKLYSHSLAPWEQHRVENDHGNHVCELVECDQPDARLIASSPEWYELGQAIVRDDQLPGDLRRRVQAILSKVDGNISDES